MINHKPLVSVLIPAFNHEKYIQQAIKSIINQDYKNIELLIIDDGSTDDTWNKIQEMKFLCIGRFVNIFFEKQKNNGVCTTLNRLIQKSNGEFILINDSDDQAKNNTLSTLVTYLLEHKEYVLAVGDNEIINQESKRIGWDESCQCVSLEDATYKTFGSFLQKYKKFDFNSDEFGKYRTFIKGNYIPNGYLIRADVLRNIGGFTTEAPLEDLYLNLQLSKYGKMKYFDEILFTYRWHDNNTVKRKAYMENITKQTYLYEKKLVENLKNKKWKKIFYDEFYQKKYYVNFFWILKCYRLKAYDEQFFIFQFGRIFNS